MKEGPARRQEERGLRVVRFQDRSELIQGFRRALASNESCLLRSSRQQDPVMEFARSVAEGLDREPPGLDCRFLYDERGSRLYEAICEQGEYYLTNAEDEILATCAPQIRERTGGVRLLELGSGNAVKTGHLLRAWLEQEATACYVPIDVSEPALRTACEGIHRRLRGVQFIAVNATYDEAFPLFDTATPAMVMFMGSTIGNLDEGQAQTFWRSVAAALHPGDFFLLGVDLVKDTAVLEAAYNDGAGVTQQFTLNLFQRMNRELGSQVDVATLRHEAHFNEETERMEIYTRFTRAQEIFVEPLQRRFQIAAGERVLVEISRKFRLDAVVGELQPFGLELVSTHTDERQRFAVLLLRRAGVAVGG